MFIFNVNNMLKELEENYSGYNILKELPSIKDKFYKEKLKELYPKCESISIDYAVMEKSKNIYVVPGNFGWDDIGTWISLMRYLTPDENENYLKGDVYTDNSKKNVIYAGKKKIVLLDIDNIFCIDTDDILVIGNKDSLSKVHELRKKLNK